jgi:hypothetical protein
MLFAVVKTTFIRGLLSAIHPTAGTNDSGSAIVEYGNLS